MCVSLNAFLAMYRRDIKTPEHSNDNPFYLRTRDGAKHFTCAVQDAVTVTWDCRTALNQNWTNKILN
jgi:hypothetical protein